MNADGKKKERALLAFGALGLLGLLGGAVYLLTRPATGSGTGGGGGGGGGGGTKRAAAFVGLVWMRDNLGCRIGVEGRLVDAQTGAGLAGKTIGLLNISGGQVMSAVPTDYRGYFRAPEVGFVDARAGGGAGWRVFFDGSQDPNYASVYSTPMAGPACAVAFVPAW